jgi:hypothetical protein
MVLSRWPDSALSRSRTSARRPLLAAGLAAAAALAALGPTDLHDRAVLALARDPHARAEAFERLSRKSGGSRVVREELEMEEDPCVREHALAAAPSRLEPDEVARILARRIARGPSPASLVDLRAAGAQGDERALEPLLGLAGERLVPERVRLAAFTALAAISTRRGITLDALPGRALDPRALLDLARGLDDDAVPWRARALRALAKRSLDGASSAALRARAFAEGSDRPDDDDDDDAAAAGDVLLLGGDRATLDRLSGDELDRAGLLLPLGVLVARRDPVELDRTIARERWGGRGAWRALEATLAWESGRAALRGSLERVGRADRPATVAALVLLSRSGDTAARERLESVASGTGTLTRWARAGLGRYRLDDPVELEALAVSGELEELPPPLVEEAVRALGPRAVVALARAAGASDGRLAFVLEPGAGTGSRRFLTDLAIEAFSTQDARER